MKPIKSAIVLSIFATFSACVDDEAILEGERLELRAVPGAEAVTAVAPETEALEITTAITLPEPVNYSAWTHAGGSPTHQITHPALATSLTQVWSVNIGTGNSRKRRITADPVVDAGRIFTLDALAGVSAVSTDGALLWRTDLTPGSDRADDASGGGLAVADGRLFVTTGFGALAALDTETGAELWRQRLGASATGAPTVVGNLVYAVSRDNRAWAVDVETGRVKWDLSGVPSDAGMVGGAGPAVDDQLAIFPFGSGEIVGVFRQGGVRIWSASVSGQRRGKAYTGVTDITGDPVVADGVVYAGNQSGRVVAVDASNGERIWTAREGAYGAVLPVAGSVFLISDQGDLMRLDDATGATIWAERLPHFKREKLRRRKGVYSHFGPLLAGGRILVASSDKTLRAYAPEDGSLLGTMSLPAGATANPIVVDRTLYLVTENGQLHAFR